MRSMSVATTSPFSSVGQSRCVERTGDSIGLTQRSAQFTKRLCRERIRGVAAVCLRQDVDADDLSAPVSRNDHLAIARSVVSGAPYRGGGHVLARDVREAARRRLAGEAMVVHPGTDVRSAGQHAKPERCSRWRGCGSGRPSAAARRRA